MSACADTSFEDTLRTFLYIVNSNPSRPLHTDEEIEEIFVRSVDRVKKFYTKFAHTTKTLKQYVNVHMSKVYIRLYKPTGNWYIGYTDLEFAEKRHDNDLTKSRTKTSTKLLKFYNDVLRTDDSREDNIVVYTIAEVKDTNSAKILEKRLIHHFTNTNVENNVLPIDLCLNIEGVYKEPYKESNSYEKINDEKNTSPREQARARLRLLISQPYAVPEHLRKTRAKGEHMRPRIIVL